MLNLMVPSPQTVIAETQTLRLANELIQSAASVDLQKTVNVGNMVSTIARIKDRRGDQRNDSESQNVQTKEV